MRAYCFGFIGRARKDASNGTLPHHHHHHNNKHGGESSENQTRNQTIEMIQAKKSTGAEYLSTKCDLSFISAKKL